MAENKWVTGGSQPHKWSYFTLFAFQVSGVKLEQLFRPPPVCFIFGNQVFLTFVLGMKKPIRFFLTFGFSQVNKGVSKNNGTPKPSILIGF